METITISKAEYEEFVALKAQVAHLERQVEYLLGQMRLSRHRQFGSSSEKSEYDGEQLNLFNEAEVFAAPESPEPELVEVEKHSQKRTRLTTDKLPDDLPVEIVEHVRLTYSCRHCEQTDITVPMIKATVPKPVIAGNFATPEAVAHTVTQKFVMGTPLYRQEQEWKRQGIPLSRQTMSNRLSQAYLCTGS